ncbi:MAG TPA: type II toxin-antitoxin system RelE/ParE family toxin [Xanthobacteraceae bacterium]|nr:type II toxin-antitoxin system RelE/ParE family toxin [Xanthobacteraceae bacterium]
MIRGFKDANTEQVFNGRCPKGFPADILSVARRKLRMVDAAVELNDLKIPPNTRLHPLEKNRKGQHAIRINDKYRVCFVWSDQGPTNVEITDYH